MALKILWSLLVWKLLTEVFEVYSCSINGLDGTWFLWIKTRSPEAPRLRGPLSFSGWTPCRTHLFSSRWGFHHRIKRLLRRDLEGRSVRPCHIEWYFKWRESHTVLLNLKSSVSKIKNVDTVFLFPIQNQLQPPPQKKSGATFSPWSFISGLRQASDF